MTKNIEAFKAQRERLNETVLKYGDKTLKRFFNIDSETYKKGALDVKTKELLGFTASLVLRCDDCIKYHLTECSQEGVSSEELAEAVNVGLVVGGSITIPHIRRAFAFWEELIKDKE